MNTYQRKKRAFTLVEVLVVVVIIGILFLVVMSRVDFTTDAARESGVDTVLNSYQLAANAVGLDRAGFTEDLSELVAQLNKRLDSELQLSVSGNTIVSSNTDPWGTEFRIEHYKPYKSNGELRFTSAGPDETFDTADDIILVSRYDTSTGRGEMVNEHPVNDPYHTHKFTQQIQDPAYLCEEANCISPTLYFNVCECGVIGTTYFSVGTPDYGKHGEKIFSYAALNDDQHTITSTCKRCKMQLSTEPANHTFDDELSMCVVCGEVVEHTHNYIFMVTSEEYLVSVADCTHAAVYYYSCSCTAMSDETFEEGSPLGHNILYGGTANLHTYCGRCNQTLSTEHVLTSTLVKESTCTAVGAQKYSCPCGYTYTDIIDVKPHTPGEDATCTKAQYCTVCNNVIMNELGHTPSYVGIDSIHSQCTRCGHIVSTHTYATEVASIATCINRGSTKYLCECGYSYTVEDVAINPSNHEGEEQFVGTQQVHSQYSCCNLLIAANHSYEKIVVTTATCQNPGETLYVCACSWSYPVIEEQTEHVWGAEATCTTAQVCVYCGVQHAAPLGHNEVYGGDISVHTKCDRCGFVMSNTHDYELDEHMDSTCVTYGRDDFLCECGAWYSEELPLVDHTPKRGSDCTQATVCEVCEAQLEAGSAHILSYDNSSASLHGVCTVCEAEITEHIFVVREYARATCTTYRQMEESCVCGYSHVYSDTVNGKDANVHTGTVVSGGTAGVHQKYSCCNATYSKNHTYTSAITTAPTCITEGVKTFTCSCNYAYTQSMETDSSNHHSTCKKVNVGQKTVHTKWNKCNQVAETAHTYQQSVVESTCVTLGKTTYTCSCGYKYEVTANAFNPNKHEKNIAFAGTAEAHEYRPCCGVITSVAHSFLAKDGGKVTYSTQCAGEATGVCKCGYVKKELPSRVIATTDIPANCLERHTLQHRLEFSTFPSTYCTVHYEGSTNPNRHKVTTTTWGGQPSVHTKYTCCGATYSSRHDYVVQPYSYSNNYQVATGTAICECGYKKQETVTGSGSIIQYVSCTRPEQTRYTYDFSSPFTDHSQNANTKSRLPHTYEYADTWKTGDWGSEFLSNHEWVTLKATCSGCALSYTETVTCRQVPNGWFDFINNPCTGTNRIEYFVYPEMTRTFDDQGHRVFTTKWRCYTDCEFTNPCALLSHRIGTGAVGHSIQSFETYQPIASISQYATCTSAGLAFTCALCKEQVTYIGEKISSGDAWQRAMLHFRTNYRTAQYCIYKLNLSSSPSISMYSIWETHSSVYDYHLFYDPETGTTYMSCNGHSSLR